MELKQALIDIVQRLEDALSRVGIESGRLSDEVSRLVLLADRLEAQVNVLSLPGGRGGPPEPTWEPQQPIPQEPRFMPGDQTVDVVVAAVPGFQGLMDLQRGLSGLASVENANVLRYQNDEASLEVTLRDPAAAREIVEGLRESIDHELIIDEARPEDLRLRLRFVDQA